MDLYQVEEQISHGTFGAVFRAVRKADNMVVAMKRTLLDGDQPTPSTANEIKLLSELKHPHVVSFLSSGTSQPFTYVVMEYCNTDLLAHIRTLRPLGKMPSAQLQGFLRQIASAIHFCHARRILHRDVKPANLLISGNGTIKLADFGLSRKLATYTLGVSGEHWNIGTLWYQAPELLLGASFHTSAVDIWAIGCVFAEMATLRPLLPRKFQIEQLFGMFQLLGTPTPARWPCMLLLPFYQATFPSWETNQLSGRLPGLGANGIDLLKKCLEYNPDRRIKAQQILTHPFFQEGDVYASTA